MRDLSYLEDLPTLYKRVKTLEHCYATQERLIQEIRLGKHQDRDEGGKTAEASHCDSAFYSAPGQGQEAKGQVQVESPYGTLAHPEGFYIAGPMSGYADHNFPQFNEVARRMRTKCNRVINPAELNPEKPGYSIAMRRDISQLLTCTHIMMLPGWERSKGARVEFDLAVILEMSIHYWAVSCNLYK